MSASDGPRAGTSGRHEPAVAERAGEELALTGRGRSEDDGVRGGRWTVAASDAMMVRRSEGILREEGSALIVETRLQILTWKG